MALTKLNFQFQNMTDGANDGNILLIEQQVGEQYTQDSDIIVIDISGTASNATTIFEAKVVSDGDWREVGGVRINDYTLATTTNNINEAWMFDIGQYHSFRCRVSSVADGYVTINSKVTNNNYD